MGTASLPEGGSRHQQGSPSSPQRGQQASAGECWSHLLQSSAPKLDSLVLVLLVELLGQDAQVVQVNVKQLLQARPLDRKKGGGWEGGAGSGLGA